MRQSTLLALLLLPIFLSAAPLEEGQWILAAVDENDIEELRTVTFEKDDTGAWNLFLTVWDLSYTVPLTVTMDPKENDRAYVTGSVTRTWERDNYKGVSTLLFRAVFSPNSPAEGHLNLFSGLAGKPDTLNIRLRPLSEFVDLEQAQ